LFSFCLLRIFGGRGGRLCCAGETQIRDIFVADGEVAAGPTSKGVALRGVIGKTESAQGKNTKYLSEDYFSWHLQKMLLNRVHQQDKHLRFS
jgi:hypothetical protein